MKKILNALMVLLITQNTHVKIPKYPQAKLFFFFYEAKNVILLYMKIKKPEIPLSNNPSFFFILRVKKYFYCYEYYEKPRKPLINNSKFC
jgi:hypothetical protein